jgi:hypothetical protein
LRYRMVLFCVQKGSAWDSMKIIFRFLVHHKIFSHGIDVLFSVCLLVSTIAKKKQRKFNFFGYQCLNVPPSRFYEFCEGMLMHKYFEKFMCGGVKNLFFYLKKISYEFFFKNLTLLLINFK